MDIQAVIIYVSFIVLASLAAVVIGHTIAFLWVYFFRIEHIVDRLPRPSPHEPMFVTNWWVQRGLWGLCYPWVRRRVRQRLRERYPDLKFYTNNSNGDIYIGYRNHPR